MLLHAIFRQHLHTDTNSLYAYSLVFVRNVVMFLHIFSKCGSFYVILCVLFSLCVLTVALRSLFLVPCSRNLMLYLRIWSILSSQI
jgi:hypothetical protein